MTIDQPYEMHAWYATWNNPQDHCDIFANFDYQTASPEQFTHLQLKIIDMFVNASRTSRKTATSSILVGCELGESGTFHLHMLFQAKRKIKFDTLKKLYDGIHLEPVYSSPDQVADYIYKQGTEKNEAKADTKLCEPMKWGDYVYTPSTTASKSKVFDEIEAMLEDGMTPQEIYAESPKLAFYANAIERTYTARKNSEIPTFQERTVYYHVGASGTGKTHILIDLEKEHGKDNVYKTPVGWRNIWDGYNYQKIIVMDELRSHCLRYSELLGYLDDYKLTLPCRYADKYADYDEVHITTIDPPEELYDWDNRDVFSSFDGREQLYRRIDYIVYHWKDKDGNFKQYQMPFDQYKNYAQLVDEAKKQDPTAGTNDMNYWNPFKDIDVAATPKCTEGTVTTKPNPNPTEIKGASSTALEIRDYVHYYNWLHDSFIFQHCEPNPREYRCNPFIQFDYCNDGIYESTEFDCLAFLEAMN